MMNWFGEYWGKDLKDIDDMRRRTGGAILTVLWFALVGGVAYGSWNVLGWDTNYLLPKALAIALLIGLILLVFVPRTLWNLCLWIGSWMYWPIARLVVSETDEIQLTDGFSQDASFVDTSRPSGSENEQRDQASQTPSVTESAILKNDSTDAPIEDKPPSTHESPERRTKKVGNILVSWISSPLQPPTEVSYHCPQCESHHEVSVKSLPPQRQGTRIATGSRNLPVGAICQFRGTLLAQWPSMGAFHQFVNDGISESS